VGTLAEDRRHYSQWPHPALTCTTKACAAPVTHWVAYRYVTGARGRVATNRRNVCERHARDFAVRWDVDVTAALPPVSALDVAVTQLLEGAGPRGTEKDR
jgi:hypothetical protein